MHAIKCDSCPFTGLVSSSLNLAYTISKFAGGLAADHVNPKLLLGASLLFSGILTTSFTGEKKIFIDWLKYLAPNFTHNNDHMNHSCVVARYLNVDFFFCSIQQQHHVCTIMVRHGYGARWGMASMCQNPQSCEFPCCLYFKPNKASHQKHYSKFKII